MTLSRHSDANGPWFLDCRKVMLRFKLRITETGERCWIDGNTAAVLFDRIKIVCGSTVICDIQNYPLLATHLENIHGSHASESKALRALRGHGTLEQRKAWGTSDSHEYIINASPIGTLLNSKCLLPLNTMNDIHIEYHLSTAQSALACDDTIGTFSLYEIELHSTYLSSKSIQSYFSSNPVAISLIDYSYRFNSVGGMTSMLKISSSYSSLNSILGYLHQSSLAQGADKRSRSCSPAVIAGMQFFTNNIAQFDIPIETRFQQFREFLEAFPSVEESDFYTDFNDVAQFLVAINLRAAPREFHGFVTSGTQTSTLNSDLCLQLNLTNAPPSDLVLDSFLCADVTIIMQGKDLYVKY